MDTFKRLDRKFFLRHPIEVAPEILGKFLIRKDGKRKIVSKIVETEAYGGKEDKACHVGRFGYTKRTRPLFGEVGYAYIYSVHINVYCLNIVAHKDNDAGGVLIRALEPIKGIKWILESLKIEPKKYNITKLLNGPGKLCKALKIDKSLNGEDMINGKKIYISAGEVIDKNNIIATPRINIPYAQESKDWLWRFIIKDSIFLSK